MTSEIMIRSTSLEWMDDGVCRWRSLSWQYYHYRINFVGEHFIIDRSDEELLPNWKPNHVAFSTLGAAKAFCEGLEWAVSNQ